MKVQGQWIEAEVVQVDLDIQGVLLHYQNGVRKWHCIDESASGFSRRGSRTTNTPGSPRKKSKSAGKKARGHRRNQSSRGSRFSSFYTPPIIYFDKGQNQAKILELASVSTNEMDQVLAFDLLLPSLPKLPSKGDLVAPAICVGSNDLVMLWHLQDTRFNSPRAEIYLNIITGLVNTSPLTSALADLLSELVFESLNEESYMAYISELDFEIEVSGVGIQLHFSGFTDKLPFLLKTVLRRLLFFCRDQGLSVVQEDGSESFFQAEKDQRNLESPVFFAQLESLVVEYINSSTQFRSSFSQVSQVLFELLCPTSFSPETKGSLCFACVTRTPCRLREPAFHHM